MLSALLLTISVVALAQFGVYYWRALMLGVAAENVSAMLEAAAGIGEGQLCGEDFEAVVELDALCPDLRPASRKLAAVRLYYAGLTAVSGLGRMISNSLSAWADREMTACTRYVAVRTSQRMERNALAYAAVRSY